MRTGPREKPEKEDERDTIDEMSTPLIRKEPPLVRGRLKIDLQQTRGPLGNFGALVSENSDRAVQLIELDRLLDHRDGTT